MLFLAGNTNKALCSAAILAVLDALYAIRTFRDLKGQWMKQQKFERRIRKTNHAFGKKSIRVRPSFIIISCAVYTSWLFRMSAKCVRNYSAEQSAVYLQSAKKDIVPVFHSVKAARLGGFYIFHKWGQINNHRNGESSVMTCRRKMLGYILWKLRASKANCA